MKNILTQKEEELREEWHKATDNSEESEFANTFDLITKKNIADWWLQKRREAIAETVETILDLIWQNRTATKELNIMMYVAMLRKKGIKPLTSKEQEEHLNDLFNYHIYCPPNCPRFKDILGDITRNI